jgi:hypothetical protein
MRAGFLRLLSLDHFWRNHSSCNKACGNGHYSIPSDRLELSRQRYSGCLQECINQDLHVKCVACRPRKHVNSVAASCGAVRLFIIRVYPGKGPCISFWHLSPRYRLTRLGTPFTLSMQHSSIHTAYRHRSPNLSDSDEADRASSSSSSSHQHNPAASSSSSATTIVNLQQQQQQQRPQRPHLQHKHTASGSFKRIKRKNTPATSPTPPATVDHQQPAAEQTTVKTCFICYGDSNEEDSSALSSGSVLGGSTSAPRKWIHPCKCSLVAHEDCLLHWVQISKPTASRSTPASCPQCNTPYTMHQLDFPQFYRTHRIYLDKKR